jgi:hypothetical protein
MGTYCSGCQSPPRAVVQEKKKKKVTSSVEPQSTKFHYNSVSSFKVETNRRT